MKLHLKSFFILILSFLILIMIFSCRDDGDNQRIVITFNSMGGSEIANMRIKTGESAFFPVPFKIGYEFLGWTLENSQVILDESYVFFQNQTLKATWALASYNIVYHNTFDIMITHLETSYTFLDEDIYLKPLHRQGFTFAGWFENETFGSEPIEIIESGRFGAIELFAKWETTLYTITFHNTLDFDISLFPITYSILETLVLETPFVDGLIFLGWYENNQGEPLQTIDAGSYGNLDLYAKWEEIPEPFYFFPQDITYDGPLLDMHFLSIVAYGAYGEGNPYRGTGGAYYVDYDLSQGIGRCIDGDTTRFDYPADIFTRITSSSKSVRYYNIDTPETRPFGSEEKWAHMATYFVCDILNDAEAIILQSDPGDNFVDRFGRLLAWVWVQMPGETDFWLLNYMILRQGLGEVRYLYGAGETEVTVYDDYTYLSWLYIAQNKAIEDGYGMHGLGMDYYWDDVNHRPDYLRLR